MWVDLDSDVAELFSDIRLDTLGMWKSRHDPFSDRHQDADTWLDASPVERITLGAQHDARLVVLRRYLTKQLERRPGRTREQNRRRQRVLRAGNADYRAKQRKAKQAWEAAKRKDPAWVERERQRLRAWRTKLREAGN